MAGIDTELNIIEGGIYGRDVRQAIHDGLEKTYRDASVNPIRSSGHASLDASNYQSYGLYDVDNFPLNQCIVIRNNITESMITHLPVYGYAMNILTYTHVPDSTTGWGAVQLAIVWEKGMFYRYKRQVGGGDTSTVWENWTRLASGDDVDAIKSSNHPQVSPDNYTTVGFRSLDDMPVNSIWAFRSDLTREQFSQLPEYGVTMTVMSYGYRTDVSDGAIQIVLTYSSHVYYRIHDNNGWRPWGEVADWLDVNEVREEVNWLKEDLNKTESRLSESINKILYTNNILTGRELIENYIGFISPTVSPNYSYFAFVPVEANKTYNLNFNGRYLVLFDSEKKNGVTTENVRSFTPAKNGYAHITILKTSGGYNNPKMWLSDFTEIDVIDYGKYWLTPNAKAQSITDTLKDEITNGLIKADKSNLFTSEGAVKGFLNRNGQITDYETYKTTDFIWLRGKYTYTLHSKRYSILYDRAKAIIDGTFTDGVATQFEITPENDCYLRYSYNVATEEKQYITYEKSVGDEKYPEGIALSESMKKEVNALIRKDPLKNVSVFDDKKWWACGDSFTEWAPDTYITAEQTNIDGLSHYKSYPYWIAKRNPLLTVYNFAVSGQTIAYPSGSGFTNAFANEKYKQIPSDIDYITLWFGINDSHHRQGSSGGDGEDNTGVIPLGTINDTTASTFYGAWNVVLEYLIEHHPYAKIGIIITNGAETNDYAQAEIKLAHKWGIAYLDLNGDYTVPLMHRVTGKTEVCERAKELRKSAFWTSSDNGHPNTRAHEFQSTFIENWMRSL